MSEAVQRAATMATGAMPYGSRGRTAQAAGKVLGKAKATLQYTVPHDQAFIGSELARLQQSVSAMVMGPRHAMTTAEAVSAATKRHGDRDG